MQRQMNNIYQKECIQLATGSISRLNRTLLVNLFYKGYCQNGAYLKLYRYDHELYFSGILGPRQIFNIEP